MHIDYFDIDFFIEKIRIINEIFNGQNISLRLSRKNLSNANIIELIKSAKSILKNNLIIEVDGISDCNKDNFNQTLQTISTADIIHKELNSKIPNIKRIPIKQSASIQIGFKISKRIPSFGFINFLYCLLNIRLYSDINLYLLNNS